MKDKETYTLEFLDLCDMITQVYFYADMDPFHKHDFTKEIPNPLTCATDLNDALYKKCTVKETGL